MPQKTPRSAQSTRLSRLERSVAGLRAYAAATTIALALLGLSAFVEEDDGILRARGLVLVDEAGRERILLGAPIPAAASRVRTDLERVQAIWGPRFPERYMEFYRAYRHDANGLAILDEDGFDRIVLGDPVPDPNIGQRIGPSTGIVINDREGFERSGWGLLDVNGTYRVSLGLDSNHGTEALSLGVHDDGPVGAWIAEGDRSIFVGSTPRDASGKDPGFHGFRFERAGEVLEELNVAGEGD